MFKSALPSTFTCCRDKLNFTYSVNLISSDVRCKKEIRSRISQDKEVFNKNESPLTSKTISLKIRQHFTRNFPWQILTYGSAMWILMKMEKTRFNACKMYYWRESKNISSKMINQEVLKRVEEEHSLLEIINQRWNNWDAHPGAQFWLRKSGRKSKIDQEQTFRITELNSWLEL